MRKSQLFLAAVLLLPTAAVAQSTSGTPGQTTPGSVTPGSSTADPQDQTRTDGKPRTGKHRSGSMDNASGRTDADTTTTTSPDSATITPRGSPAGSDPTTAPDSGRLPGGSTNGAPATTSPGGVTPR